jgi:hypothetical protein
MDKFNLPDLCGALADFLDRVNNGQPLKIGGRRAADTNGRMCPITSSHIYEHCNYTLEDGYKCYFRKRNNLRGSVKVQQDPETQNKCEVVDIVSIHANRSIPLETRSLRIQESVDTSAGNV